MFIEKIKMKMKIDEGWVFFFLAFVLVNNRFFNNCDLILVRLT